jgi:ADP-ribose pyrophosphatase YjhB (NUDIX family)
LREETGLGVYLTDLVGIYNGPLREVRSLRFVYAGHAVTGTAAPGDDILEVRWLTSREMGALPPEEVVAPSIFRRIVSDLETGLTWPTRVVTEE